MKISSEQLLNDLQILSKQLLTRVEKLEQLDNVNLNKKNTAESWSILECLEHLNLYGNFYLPEIAKCINNSDSKPSTQFKSGFLGNYSAKSMKPKPQLNKMKTFKSKNPIGSKLTISTIHEFTRQLKELSELIELAKKVNINKTKTKTTLPIIKFKLGDTLRFYLYHIERHVVQAEKLVP